MVAQREIECEACGDLIEGQPVRIAGKYYHRSCLRNDRKYETEEQDFVDRMGFNPFKKYA